MQKIKLNIIAAVGQNGVIGAAGGLPWRLPDDLAYFYRKTAGSVCIIGRKAFAEMPKKKFLEGRQVIVLTRDLTFTHPGVRVAHSKKEVLDWVVGFGGNAWVCGGAEIYQLFLPAVSRLYLTEVVADIAGDAHFPTFDKTQWTEELRVPHVADAQHAHAFDFTVYARKMLAHS